jgi:hypothetical protein
MQKKARAFDGVSGNYNSPTSLTPAIARGVNIDDRDNAAASIMFNLDNARLRP